MSINVYSKRDNALDIVLNLLALWRSFKLKNNRYYKIRTKRRLSLLILIMLNIIYFNIDIAAK